MDSFCLKGTGNVELNRESAEKNINNLKMARKGYLVYVKKFTEAAQNLKLCESQYTSEKIIGLFDIRHHYKHLLLT